MDFQKELPNGVINPFSPAFLDTWLLWKQYKWEQHKFKYKGCISEQVAIMKLTQICDGKEEIAVLIIMQSIGEGWAGLFPLKAIKINKNGTGKQPANNNEARQQLNELYNNGSGRWG